MAAQTAAVADGDERTAEERDAARLERERARTQVRDRRPAARSGAAPPRPRRHSLTRRIAALLALVIAAALIWFLAEVFQPFHGPGHGSVTVAIAPHSTAGRVGDQLARAGVIGSGFFFDVRATLDGERSHLLPGTYHLKLGMSYGAVLKILTTPPPPAKVTNVTIIPGHTRAQVAALLSAQGVAGSYLAATRSSPLLDPRAYGAPRHTPSLEGFLFPDTFQLVEPIKISALVADQLRDFRRQFATVDLSYARSKHLTPYDVLIIASLVEGEARVATDARLVASVIYNRLAAGMPLGLDSTTRYATGNYTKPLTVSQLASPSPYNTRVHTGLPPTPIDSPDLAAIEAAAHPARTRYLYFVNTPCANGKLVFSSSYKQFELDVQGYEHPNGAIGRRLAAHC